MFDSADTMARTVAKLKDMHYKVPQSIETPSTAQKTA
jgi:hypothetical protein